MRDPRRRSSPWRAGAPPWAWKGHAEVPWGRRDGEAWRRLGRRIVVGALLLLVVVVGGLLALGAVIGLAVSGGVDALGVLTAAVVGLVIVVAVAAAGKRAMRRTWFPVRDLIHSAGRLAEGDYSARVAPQASPALAPVVASFNEMARRLEVADEQRRRLLADIGHELRTPLTVIRGELEAMVDGVHRADPEELEQLLDEVATMERLLSDLRLLSLAEAGALDLHPEPTDIGDLVADVVDNHQRAADAAGVVTAVTVDPGVGEVMVDPVRIREVVTNLVVNALRAMPGGGSLRVGVRRIGGEVVIDVTDTGGGIPAEELDAVFERFHKGSTSSGSGLGLTISKDLVEAHGGSIAITSAVGRGTTVTVRLPTG